MHRKKQQKEGREENNVMINVKTRGRFVRKKVVSFLLIVLVLSSVLSTMIIAQEESSEGEIVETSAVPWGSWGGGADVQSGETISGAEEQIRIPGLEERIIGQQIAQAEEQQKVEEKEWEEIERLKADDISVFEEKIKRERDIFSQLEESVRVAARRKQESAAIQEAAEREEAGALEEAEKIHKEAETVAKKQEEERQERTALSSASMAQNKAILDSARNNMKQAEATVNTYEKEINRLSYAHSEASAGVARTEKRIEGYDSIIDNLEAEKEKTTDPDKKNTVDAQIAMFEREREEAEQEKDKYENEVDALEDSINRNEYEQGLAEMDLAMADVDADIAETDYLVKINEAEMKKIDEALKEENLDPEKKSELEEKRKALEIENEGAEELKEDALLKRDGLGIKKTFYEAFKFLETRTLSDTAAALGNFFLGIFETFNEYKQVGAMFGSLFIGDDELNERRNKVNQEFCKTILLGGTGCWASKICEKYADTPPGSSVMVSLAAVGDPRLVAHIEAERTPPLQFVNETGQKRKYWTYKITYYITNTADHQILYNVEFNGPNYAAKIFSADQQIDSGSGDGRVGSGAFVKTTDKDYDRVCILFSPSIESVSGRSVDRICNNIIEYSGAATKPYAEEEPAKPIKKPKKQKEEKPEETPTPTPTPKPGETV